MRFQSFLSVSSLGALLLATLTAAQTYRTKPLSFGMVLFPGFTPLDVYGPLEILFQMSEPYNITLSTISFKEGPVPARSPPHKAVDLGPPGMPSNSTPGGGMREHSRQISPETIATHTFANAPKLDVILVPGGIGSFVVVGENNMEIENFLNERSGEVEYLLSVCSGAVNLARAGLLKGRKATTNKKAWSWVTKPEHGEGIEWVPSARWVQDGNVWTSSGVSAGIDMMYAFMKHVYGPSKIDDIMNRIEYVPHLDSRWDPFSVIQKVCCRLCPSRPKERGWYGEVG
ncbi:class I glutamine amidotransferase-like protein [Massariosphaeria phaeospora]|uniref:Class I glutamine amidotransferase-like protein n=1 Tax=Massariosphaeria phaeospora TaxID=100035 RepID=A0A7C8M6I1_9PLEO|nr:class I glutamine amidotransferase-like protein [Massariosphaeria phaeospora]